MVGGGYVLSDSKCVRYALPVIAFVCGMTALDSEHAPQLSEAAIGPPITIRIGFDQDSTVNASLPQSYPETRALLPEMRRSETRRFVILSDLSDEEVASHGQLLERTAHAVEEFRVRLGLEVAQQGSREKMLAVAFSRRSDFLDFAYHHDDIEASWMAGYFSPTTQRLVYFHARDIPSARIAARRIDHLVAMGGDSSDARASLNDFVNSSTSAVVVHEAVHMILHERGIMPANSNVPLWLAEGLAAAFEPLEASRQFGPARRENGRTKAFRSDLAAGRVPPVAALVASISLPDNGDDSVRRFYDASAAFCSWLVREEPVALAHMIRLTLKGEVGASRGERLRVFEKTFGSISTLESRWLWNERQSFEFAVR